MTIHLRGAEAVAEFLEYVAGLLRRGVVEAVSLEMTTEGRCRANVVFSAASSIEPRDLGDFNDGADTEVRRLPEPPPTE